MVREIVYLNPVHNVVQIEFTHPDNEITGEVLLFDCLGCQVAPHTLLGIRSVVNLTDLPQGIYHLVLASPSWKEENNGALVKAPMRIRAGSFTEQTQ
jgi:hypothetical protein